MKKIFAFFVFAFCFMLIYKVDSFALEPNHQFYVAERYGQHVRGFVTSDVYAYFNNGSYSGLYIWNGSSYVSYNDIYYFLYTTPPGETTDFDPISNSSTYPRDSSNFLCPIITNLLEPPLSIDDGLASDVYITHSEFKFLNEYLETFTVRGAFNYSAYVKEYYIEVFVNGNVVNSYIYNFNVLDSLVFTRIFTSSSIGANYGDSIRVLAQPIGLNNERGLKRGIEWIVGSGEELVINKIPYVDTKIETPFASSEPIAQPTKKITISPQGDEITNNYYEQTYFVNEPYDDSIISDKLDSITEWLNKHENYGESPQTIINNNYNNKYFQFEFDTDLSGNDINLGIGNAKQHVKNSFESFTNYISPLLATPFEPVVIAIISGVGLIIAVLVIVIIAKLIDIILP